MAEGEAAYEAITFDGGPVVRVISAWRAARIDLYLRHCASTGRRVAMHWRPSRSGGA